MKVALPHVPAAELDRIHAVERMAFVMRTCGRFCSGYDLAMALVRAGFKLDVVAEHYDAAHRRAWGIRHG